MSETFKFQNNLLTEHLKKMSSISPVVENIPSSNTSEIRITIPDYNVNENIPKSSTRNEYEEEDLQEVQDVEEANGTGNVSLFTIGYKDNSDYRADRNSSDDDDSEAETTPLNRHTSKTTSKSTSSPNKSILSNQSKTLSTLYAPPTTNFRHSTTSSTSLRNYTSNNNFPLQQAEMSNKSYRNSFSVNSGEEEGGNGNSGAYSSLNITNNNNYSFNNSNILLASDINDQIMNDASNINQPKSKSENIENQKGNTNNTKPQGHSRKLSLNLPHMNTTDAKFKTKKLIKSIRQKAKDKQEASRQKTYNYGDISYTRTDLYESIIGLMLICIFLAITSYIFCMALTSDNSEGNE